METRGRFKILTNLGTIVYLVALLVATVYVAMQATGLILNFIILVFGYLWVFSVIYLILKRASG